MLGDEAYTYLIDDRSYTGPQIVCKPSSTHGCLGRGKDDSYQIDSSSSAYNPADWLPVCDWLFHKAVCFQRISSLLVTVRNRASLGIVGRIGVLLGLSMTMVAKLTSA